MLAIMNTDTELFSLSLHIRRRPEERSMPQNPEIRSVGTTRGHVDLKRGVRGVLVRHFFRQHLQVPAVRAVYLPHVSIVSSRFFLFPFYFPFDP